MLSKQQIKFVKSLQLNKYRLKYDCFVAEGNHVVNDFIKFNFKIKWVFSTEEWGGQHMVATNIVKRNELSKMSSLKNTPNVLAVFYKPKCVYNLHNVIKKRLIIMLESVSDPGNLGSIIRTADWYGVSDIYLSEQSVDVFNPKVIQSSMGSLARVRVHVVDLKKMILDVKKFHIPFYAATLCGENVYQIQKPKSCALVFGSESHGISSDLLSMMDKQIFIPSKNSSIDSLNVGVAFGIILSEFR